MHSQGNNINLLKQLPFQGRTIKSRIKNFTKAKLLFELPFFEKPKKAKTKQVEIINNKNLSDSMSVSKNSIKILFDELLREKMGFKYIISVKITLKKTN